MSGGRDADLTTADGAKGAADLVATLWMRREAVIERGAPPARLPTTPSAVITTPTRQG